MLFFYTGTVSAIMILFFLAQYYFFLCFSTETAYYADNTIFPFLTAATGGAAKGYFSRAKIDGVM